MYSTRAIQTASGILQRRRQQARQEAAARQEKLFARYPELEQYDQRLRSLTRSIALAAVSGKGAETEPPVFSIDFVGSRR